MLGTIQVSLRVWRIKEAKDRLAREREEINLNSGGGKYAKIFSGKEIKKATNNFSRDRTDHVLNEVRILCQVNHKSLVGLLGCCVGLEQPLMVYEYVPNGTLLDHLQGLNRKPLAWTARLNVAHATAEGLAYLHFSAVPPIYHRDSSKYGNILLDDKLNAKVSDFGLSRIAHTDLSHISTDVYSFGVVLLELLTSEKAIDFNRPEDDVNLAVYEQRLGNFDILSDAVMNDHSRHFDTLIQTIRRLYITFETIGGVM
ncbi:unnamed protein product [Coffea canephora]|uniref:Protein kinase domain-containing protein n=1 Tax=Coffea canephora TaxID=49390 RepID=A0A068V5K2_COFCA|nr:unnamed protein product [Coffea canephora]